MESLDEVTDSDNRLDAIAGEFAERLRRGEGTTVEAYVAAHPDLAEDLRLLLPSVAAMEELKQRHLTSSGRTGFLGLPTERLGDFRILRKIGRGGMGIVYEAEQESLGRRVALKTLPHAAFLLPHQVERFHQEAETAARLQHPNIVPIHSVGTEQGVHYFAMARIDGVSLDRLLHRDEDSGDDAILAATLAWLQPPAAATRGPRAERAGFWRRVALIGAQAADALECAHQNGVLHRDIKPSNLLLEPDGKVWVTDFGIAKVRDEDGMTRTGEFLGTLQYAPPEQIDGAFDARGDVYSLGLTLYELAARRPAFRGKSRVEFADRIRNGIPRSLRQVDPEIPRDLETIVGVATAFEPAHRYASAALLAEDLRRFADGLPIRAREVAVVERLWRWSRRNPGTAALAVSTVLAFLVAATVGWYSYLSTTSALDREREAKLLAQGNLLQAQSATARTEANLSLSLRSLDDLYEAIVGDPTLGTLDEELSDVPVFPALSQKDLDLLRRTLAFYERFGSTNASDVRLRRETARAFRRVGDVQRWTGALADADAAYGRALQLFDELLASGDDPGLLVEQAAVHKDLGILNADRGNLQASLRHFNRARQILGDEVRERPSPRNRYELARVFNAMGANMTRQEIAPGRMSGMSPSMMARAHAVDCHQQAVALAQSLVAEQADLHHRLLLARSHRLLAQALSLAPDQRRSGAAIDASMRILADLAVEHGHSPGCQYELAEGNCLMGTLWRDAAEGERRCREGLRQARELVVSHPTVPQYQDLLARGLRRLADVLARAGRTDESFQSLVESAGIRSGLWGRFPRAPHHLWELATVRQSMAAIESQRGNLAVARELLATVIQEVEGFGSDWSAFFYLGRILPDLRNDLVRVLDALGETTAADKVRAASSEAPWMDRYSPPWRPR